MVRDERIRASELPNHLHRTVLLSDYEQPVILTKTHNRLEDDNPMIGAVVTLPDGRQACRWIAGNHWVDVGDVTVAAKDLNPAVHRYVKLYSYGEWEHLERVTVSTTQREERTKQRIRDDDVETTVIIYTSQESNVVRDGDDPVPVSSP